VPRVAVPVDDVTVSVAVGVEAPIFFLHTRVDVVESQLNTVPLLPPEKVNAVPSAGLNPADKPVTTDDKVTGTPIKMLRVLLHTNSC